MKLIDQVLAFLALQRLAEKEMSFGDSYALYKALDKVRGNVEFFREKERQLMEKYGEKEDGVVKVDEQGRFRVTDPVMYKADHDGLCALECDELDLTLDKPETIRADDLLVLDKLVTWRES